MVDHLLFLSLSFFFTIHVFIYDRLVGTRTIRERGKKGRDRAVVTFDNSHDTQRAHFLFASTQIMFNGDQQSHFRICCTFLPKKNKKTFPYFPLSLSLTCGQWTRIVGKKLACSLVRNKTLEWNGDYVLSGPLSKIGHVFIVRRHVASSLSSNNKNVFRILERRQRRFPKRIFSSIHSSSVGIMPAEIFELKIMTIRKWPEKKEKEKKREKWPHRWT